MAFFYKCGFKKIIAGLPCLLAVALILYISIIFIFQFIPYRWPEYQFIRLFFEVSFYWFSSMTLISIFNTAASDPGYLSAEYSYPLTPEGYAPLK